MEQLYEKGCNLGNKKACIEKNKSHIKEKATSFLYSFIFFAILFLLAGPVVTSMF